MAYQPFEKYSNLLNPGLLGRPNGRPVGVTNGMGQRPNVPSNPTLGGLRNAPTPIMGILPNMNNRMLGGGFGGLANPEGGATKPMPSAPTQGGFGGLVNQMSSRMPPNQNMNPMAGRGRNTGLADANTILQKYGMGGMRSQLGY